MKKLVASVSFALLTLSFAACAVDSEDVDSSERERSSIQDKQEAFQPSKVPVDQDRREKDSWAPNTQIPVNVDLRELPESTPKNTGENDPRIDAQIPDYCEQNYDCESNICDQSTNECHDYPF